MSSSYYKQRVKYCIVPQCESTTRKTPYKLFIYVPHNKKIREKWLNSARRGDALSLSTHSRMYFCEDHFDLPNDMGNYTEYYIRGKVSQICMRPGCIPSKFECQKDRIKRTGSNIERPYILTKQRMMAIAECINNPKGSCLPSSSSQDISDVNLVGEDAAAPMVKQECPEEPQPSRAAAGAGEVKVEPADASVDMQQELKVEVGPSDEGSSECSEEEAPVPLIDIVKCEPTLIQTLDDGLRPSHCSASGSTAPSAEREYRCDVCNKIYSNKKNLSSHIKIHFKRLKCDVCEKMFIGKCDLLRHMNIHTKLVKWQCDVCSKVFYRKSDYKSHMNGHSELVEWPCDVCNKVFANKSNLKRHKNCHMITHSIQMKFECDVCNKVFTTKAWLKKHKMVHMNAHSIQMKFECDVCNKVFTSIGWFKRHKKGHMNTRSKQINLKCDICEMVYDRKCEFILHMKSHFPLTKWKCNVCNNMFYTKLGLNTHMERHLKVTKWECHACNKVYYRTSDYTAHMNMHFKSCEMGT